MEITCTYTFADFRESLLAIRKSPGRSPKSREGLWAILIAFALMIAFAIMNNRMSQRGPSGQFIPTVWSTFAISMMPMTIILGILWALLVPRTDPVFRNLQRTSLLVLTAFILAAMAVGALHPPPPEPKPSSNDTFAELLPFGIILIGVLVVLIRVLRAQVWRSWIAQPHLQLRQTIRIADASVELQNERFHTTYQWQAFLCYRETTNLFVLQTSKLAFVMIPKRCCHDGSGIESLRTILESHVSNAHRTASGFPLSTTPPPLPRMVEPLPPRMMN